MIYFILGFISPIVLFILYHLVFRDALSYIPLLVNRPKFKVGDKLIRKMHREYEKWELPKTHINEILEVGKSSYRVLVPINYSNTLEFEIAHKDFQVFKTETDEYNKNFIGHLK